MSNPVNSQDHENRGLFSRANQKANIAAIQKKIDNASIVMMNEPKLKIGVTLSARTAQSPALGPASFRAK